MNSGVDAHRAPVHSAKFYAIRDLLYIYNSKSYINEKGYLQKLVDLLFQLGYYESNKSIFNIKEIKIND